MSLPYSKFVPITAVVQTPSFSVEKQHMLLAMVNDLIPTTQPFIEFVSVSALADFKSYFGSDIPEYAQLQKYFGFLSKIGNSPDKVVIARWYKEDAAPFYKGSSDVVSLTELQSVSNGSFGINFDGTSYEVVVDLSSATSYSDVASLIQTSIREGEGQAFTNATVTYNSITKGFIIVSGENGSTATVGELTNGTTGTNILPLLGLKNAILSQGVNSETYSEFCDRLFNANTSGYSITTLETLTDEDIQSSVQWLQGSTGNQTHYTVLRLVFNINDKATAEALSTTLENLDYTGYVICYDPNEEFINILDCAICASIDYEVTNGAINFNFQPAVGYTPITNLGDVVNYQTGQTNLSLSNELDSFKISYVYSVGFGNNSSNYYGLGLMANAFGTEDIQTNEAWLEKRLQVDIMNGLTSLNKLKLQGQDAVQLVSSFISPSFEQGKVNGAIAQNGTLSNNDRSTITQTTGNTAAADCVEQNGYYFQVQPLTAEDISQRRVRVLSCYLAGGVVNQVRITNNIYGA